MTIRYMLNSYDTITNGYNTAKGRDRAAMDSDGTTIDANL